jgi:hypothetical protein
VKILTSDTMTDWHFYIDEIASLLGLFENLRNTSETYKTSKPRCKMRPGLLSTIVRTQAYRRYITSLLVNKKSEHIGCSTGTCQASIALRCRSVIDHNFKLDIKDLSISGGLEEGKTVLP